MPTGNNWKLNVPTSVPYGFALSPNLYSAAGKPSVNPSTMKYGIGDGSKARDVQTAGDYWNDFLSWLGFGDKTNANKTEGSTIQGTLDELGQLFWAIAALVLVVFIFKIFNPKK